MVRDLHSMYTIVYPIRENDPEQQDKQIAA